MQSNVTVDVIPLRPTSPVMAPVMEAGRRRRARRPNKICPHVASLPAAHFQLILRPVSIAGDTHACGHVRVLTGQRSLRCACTRAV